MPATVTRWALRGIGAEETYSADVLIVLFALRVCVHALLWGEHGCGNPQTFLHTPCPDSHLFGYPYFPTVHACVYTFCFSQSIHGYTVQIHTPGRTAHTNPGYWTNGVFVRINLRSFIISAKQPTIFASTFTVCFTVLWTLPRLLIVFNSHFMRDFRR